MTAYDEDIKRRDELGKAYARGFADGLEIGFGRAIKALRANDALREKLYEEAAELRSEGGGQD